MWEEFDAFLEHFELNHSYEVAIDTTIDTLICTITHDLETSDQSFTFASSIQSRYIQSCERLGLDLLEIINQRVWRPRTGQIYLQQAFTTLQMDLNMVVNSNQFVHPNLTIVDSCITLHFI